MITGLFVKLPQQRAGIGHELVSATIEAALAQGCTVCLLKTLKNASWAKEFYLHEGFRIPGADGSNSQEWQAAKRVFFLDESAHFALFYKQLLPRSDSQVL